MSNGKGSARRGQSKEERKRFEDNYDDIFKKQNSSDPRLEEDGKFWFWNEVWADKVGPYDTAAQRDKALEDYVRSL